MLGKDASPSKRRLAWRTLAVIALIVLSITALLTASIVKIRQDALDRARLQASYLSAALEEDAEGSLDSAAVASEFVKRHVEAEGDAAPLAELKQQVAKYIPHLIGISVIGPDGRLRATSGDVASSPADFSQFDFFIANRDSTGSGFRIGKPVTGLVSKGPVIPATQRLEDKDGAFAGVLLFSIDTARATAMYRRVDLGNSGSLIIVGDDGTIFFGYTLPRGLDPSLIGTPMTEEVTTRLRGAPSGSYIATSPIDGIERIYSWRRLDDFPLIALVGLGKAEALASANREAILMSGLGILSIGLLLALTAMLAREISRRIKQALALETQRRKLKEVNAECTSAKRQAEQANQSKSLFLANIGHELRTPLTAISGFSEIIRDKVFGNDLDRYTGYASDIYGAATHLIELIKNLLDSSKIEAGKFELHERVLDLSRIEADCLRLVRGQAENRGIQLTAGPPGTSISLYADETAFKQIILNILSNAIKFTPAGGTVSLGRTLDADGSLTFTVGDSGVGMTEDEVRRALEPFQQVQNALSRQRDGTGLGLPLAAQLTELHGGWLTIESHPGQGTTVSVHFPPWRLNSDNTLENFKPQDKEHDPPSSKRITKLTRKH
jgi:two-component system, cell cycle sensor histidine kinase PleC